MGNRKAAWQTKATEIAEETTAVETTAVETTAVTEIAEPALKRGDIYFADLEGLERSRGSEQTGRRPVLVIQNDIGNQYAPTTIVAILTSKRKRYMPTHVPLRKFAGLNRASTVCLEQIKTIDKSRLEEYCGNIGQEAMEEIEKAIAVSLGIGKEP